jgi:hypothetical protein
VDSQTLLRRLLPRVIAWGERTAERAARHGLPLQDTALADASAVGVRHPERIRVLLVDDFPLPEDTLLARAAGALGFFGAATAGLTLGYSILVRRGRLSRSLLSHECRHVAQVEAAGSLSAFLTAYLTSVVSVGYDHCPFELDARRHELPNESLRWRPI